jgi:hypothetical protein
MYPGTCLLAPLGSTKFNVTMLSNTEGAEVDSDFETADDRQREAPLTCDTIFFDLEVKRRNIVDS